jgi:hypothetical protein
MSAPSIVHARADWKSKVGRHVALCQKWAFTPGYGVTSEDNTKVNCTRCAKKLGITPAPRVASSTAGTCQCCFNAQETRQRAGDQLMDEDYITRAHLTAPIKLTPKGRKAARSTP